jgi:hypothetical protein
MLLQSLNDSWEGFVSVTVQAARDQEPDFNKVAAQILDEERRRKGQETSITMLALQKKAGQQNQNYCSHCKRTGHTNATCRKLHPELALAHWKGGRKARTEGGTALDDIEKEEGRAEALMARNPKDGDRAAWILDSGATQHMCCDMGAFQKFVPSPSAVYLGDGQLLQAHGRGTVRLLLALPDGTENPVIAENVLFVPALNTNLLSVKQLVRRGYNVGFQDSQAQVRRKDSSVLALGYLRDSLYELGVAQLSTHGSKEVWHIRCFLPCTL